MVTPADEAAQDSEVVVFLLGWTGSKTRFLEKYADVYRKILGLDAHIELFTDHADLWVTRLPTNSALRKCCQLLITRMVQSLSAGSAATKLIVHVKKKNTLEL